MNSAIVLPEEVWMHVFQFLSTPEKFSIRASCRFFKSLIDRPALWKNSTAQLGKISSLQAHFWRTLSKIRIKSVVVPRATSKEWSVLALRLPHLQSVTLDVCCDTKTFHSLSELKNLKRLVLRRCQCPSLTMLPSLQQLSDLSLCEVICAPTSDIINAVSQLTNLTSLHYHESNKPLSKAAIHTLLQGLPNLKQLSLNMGSNQCSTPDDYFCPPQSSHLPENPQCRVPALISLELLNYMDPVVSAVAMQGLSYLKCLTLQYRDWIQEPKPCHLKTWLSSLPALSELNISMGYHLSAYANSVPLTLHHLSLKNVMAELKDVRDIAKRLPHLIYLHLDLCYPGRKSPIAVVPQLFPKLQSLAIRHQNVPEAEFLRLAQLSHLKSLVILDPTTGPDSALNELTLKLHNQTNYRVRVIHSFCSRSANNCERLYAMVVDLH